MSEKKSEMAFVLAMDIRASSELSPSDHDKLIANLYPQIANIVNAGGKQKVLDRKTIGDGFIFYFENVSDAAEVAMNLRMLFRENFFWTSNKFEKHLSCRIGLHAGQFFRMYDAVEERNALFGQNVITVARLEPVVRDNEAWCTENFKNEALINRVNEHINFESLGICELAKGWSPQQVYALYRDGEPRPEPLQDKPQHRVIYHDNNDRDFPLTYFALIRLKYRSDGVEFLKNHLSKSAGFDIEAIYSLFGAFDVLVRFKAREEQNERAFAEFLVNGRIMKSKDRLELNEIHFESEGVKSKEPIVAMPPGSMVHMKAFTYIKSSTILGDRAHIQRVVDLARGACGNRNGVVTYYTDRDTLILPIVIRTADYYSLGKAVENIEDFVDDQQWDQVSITTYVVQEVEEFFPENNAK